MHRRDVPCAGRSVGPSARPAGPVLGLVHRAGLEPLVEGREARTSAGRSASSAGGTAGDDRASRLAGGGPSRRCARRRSPMARNTSRHGPGDPGDRQPEVARRGEAAAPAGPLGASAPRCRDRHSGRRTGDTASAQVGEPGQRDAVRHVGAELGRHVQRERVTGNANERSSRAPTTWSTAARS